MIFRSITVQIKREDAAETLIIALTDCDKNSQNVHNIPRRSSIRIKVSFQTREGKHFEAGDEHFFLTHTVISILFILAYLPQIRPFFKEMKKSAGEANYAYLVVHSGMLLKVVSFGIEIINLAYFKLYGDDLILVNFLGQMGNYLAQYLICCLYIFIAYGWTIRVDDIDDFEFFLPVSILIGVFKIVMLAVGRVTLNDPDYHHRYDGFVGYILGTFHFCLFLYFLYGVRESLGLAKKGKEKRFYSVWGWFGSFYFLCFPVILVVSGGLEAHWRNYFVESAKMIAEFVGILYTCWVVTARKGVYRDVASFSLQLPSTVGY